MAFHIHIEKLTETATEATFRFYDTAYPNEVGELQLNKADESITMLKETRQTFFLRAARKVAVAYKTGSLPNFLEWAS
jgi:hypothetical protein